MTQGQVHRLDRLEREHLEKVARARAAETSGAAVRVEERVLAQLDAARRAAGRYDAAAELLRLLRMVPAAERVMELTLALFCDQ